jgi:5-bromo-4-chloroindolyl phosphate hydrolysis protein
MTYEERMEKKSIKDLLKKEQEREENLRESFKNIESLKRELFEKESFFMKYVDSINPLIKDYVLMNDKSIRSMQLMIDIRRREIQYLESRYDAHK